MATKIEQATKLIAEIKAMASDNPTALAMLKLQENELTTIVNANSEKPETMMDGDTLDWVTIEEFYKNKITNWIIEVKQSSDRAKGYIVQESEGGETSIWVDALLGVIGNINMTYTISIAILTVAAESVKQEQPNNITSFHKAWIDNLDKQKKAIGFEQFQTYIYQKFYGMHEGHDDLNSSKPIISITQAELIKIMNEYVDSRLFPAADAQKMYVDAWLDSAMDQDTGFLATKDHDAGYICIVMRYICPFVANTPFTDYSVLFTNGTWYFEKAYIDDIERPKGTIQSILGTYDDVSLLELPYKIVLKINAEGANRDTGTNLAIPKQEFVRVNGKWSITRGNKELFYTWHEKQKSNIKVSNLSPE